MPLYEYKCRSCGKVFEVIQKFSDTPLTTHADCGGEVEKLISKSALHFKGSGWYVSDYAKGSSATIGNSGDGKPAGDSKSGDAKSGETKASEAKSGDSGSSASSASSESKPAATASPVTSSESK